MRLVVSYNLGDECCCCDYDTPVLYESEEALLVDLEKACLDWLPALDREWDARLRGTNLVLVDFIENGKFYAPRIQPLEEWWQCGAEVGI